jgi:hypothetical protein
MSSRRTFVKEVGAAMVVLSPVNQVLSKSTSPGPMPLCADKELRIGIIGAENSHSHTFARKFNIEKSYPGVAVTHIWGETEEFARVSAEKGNIPNIVSDPMEMMGEINALIVDHRHGKYHLAAARPFVENGIPSFIDKPFCYRADKGYEFLQMAHTLGTAVSSLSSVAYTRMIRDIREELKAEKKIGHVVLFSPAYLKPEYGGVFYYVVHAVQILTMLFGEAISRVRMTRSGDRNLAAIQWESGLMATVPLIEQYYGYNLHVETGKGLLSYQLNVGEDAHPIFYTDLVEMFRTGREPREHRSILNEVSVLEALERSHENQQWEAVNYTDLGY